MKKILFVLALSVVFSSSVFSQLVVKINDKVVAENQVIDATTINKVVLSFSNLKKLKAYSIGKVVLLLEFVGTEGSSLAEYYIVKNGENAIDAFVNEPKATFTVYEKGGANNTFTESSSYDYDGKQLNNILKKGTEYTQYTSLRVKASIYFKDKIGYEKYGDPVDLAKPVNFKVLNGVNKDGSYTLQNEAGAKISAEAAKSSDFFGQHSSKNVLKLANPFLSNQNTLVVSLKKADREYDRVYMNVVDTRGKTQEEVIDGLRKKMDEFLIRMSNCCNKSLQAKLSNMTSEEEDTWLQFIKEDNYAMTAPLLNKEENKDFEKEVPMKPFTIGLLSGFKYSSIFRTSYCKDPVEKRSLAGQANIYLAKHPKNVNQVLIIFNYGGSRDLNAESAKVIEAKVEKFISGLFF